MSLIKNHNVRYISKTFTRQITIILVIIMGKKFKINTVEQQYQVIECKVLKKKENHKTWEGTAAISNKRVNIFFKEEGEEENWMTDQTSKRKYTARNKNLTAEIVNKIKTNS